MAEYLKTYNTVDTKHCKLVSWNPKKNYHVVPNLSKRFILMIKTIIPIALFTYVHREVLYTVKKLKKINNRVNEFEITIFTHKAINVPPKILKI